MQVITPKVSFALKFNDISLSDTAGDYPLANNVGIINSIRTSATWYSINFEEILGDMYKKYDFFNLRLRLFQHNAQAAFGTTANDRSCYFQMSGLNFNNSNYDTARGCNVGTTIIGSHILGTAASTTTFDDAFIVTIRKQNSANITITYIDVENTPPTTPALTLFPRAAFYFDLTPVYIDIPKTIELASTKCSSLYTYYLNTTTVANQIDMYAVLGRENFVLGDKYNLVLKFVQASINANYTGDMPGYMFLVESSGMRFQNYETPIGKAGGNKMQMVTYNSFQGSIGTLTASASIRNQTSGIMTFTLEAQICNMTIKVLNTVDNSENSVALGNIIIVFDIWKCIE
jgi:hypothetical protein